MSTTEHSPITNHQVPRRALRWTIGSFAAVIVVSVTAGLVAALLGGSFTDLGSGAGGLYGIPSLLTTAIAVFVAMPVAVLIARQTNRSPGWLRLPIVIAVGAWIVAIGYFQVAHSFDPCVNGWWDASSRIGDQPLCERFGHELNWHTRFHLIAHAAPAAVLLAAYIGAIRRWATPAPNTSATN